MRSTTTTALLLVLSINAIQCVNWSNITATELKDLPTSVFRSITADELSSIPSQACQGFQELQVRALPSTAASGLNASCLSQFPTTRYGACSGFASAFVGAMDPQSFAGWTAGCTKQLGFQAFTQVKAEQWAQINSSACSGFNDSTVTNFNSTSGGGMTAACLSQFSTASYGGCSGLQPAFVGSINPQAFAGWTAECTKQLPSQAFAQVKAEQWAQINSSACSGFKHGTVTNFNSTSGVGMTAACLSRFSTRTTTTYGGCDGLQAEFVGSINPQAISGLQADCIKQAPSRAFSKVSSEQLAALTDSSCAGFRDSQSTNFPPSAAPGLKVGCLANFSTSTFDGACQALPGPFVGQMTPSTFEGFSKDCIRVGLGSLLAYINSTQMSHIPPLSFQGLYSGEVFRIPDEAWNGVSKSQLTYLTYKGFTGVRASVLKIIVNMHKLDIVNIFTVEQTSRYSLEFAAEFKSFIPSQVPFMTEWDTISQDLSSVTWLKIALLKKSDQRAVQGPVFNAETIRSLHFSAFEGLRVDHVPLIAAADFRLFNENHTIYFPNDTVSAISSDQLRELSPVAFGVISPFALSGLNPQVVSAITGDQIRYLTEYQIRLMSCKQLQAFSTDQLNDFDEYQKQIFNSTYDAQCGVIAPLTAPYPPNVNSPGSSPSGTQSPVSGAEIFLIVVAAVLSAVVIGGVIYFFVRRRRTDPERIPLL